MELLTNGDPRAPNHLVFAHGAGAGMESGFMEKFAAMLGGEAIAVHRFEFGYMAARRTGGSRRPPPKAETLKGEYIAATREVRRMLTGVPRIFIGGKSMGGRVASMVAQELYNEALVSGLVCAGYPFHPPEKPAQLRTAHLLTLTCPALIVQGTRDPFGTREDVASYGLPDAIAIRWIENGDHDFKGAGRGVLDRVVAEVAQFVTSST